MKRNTVIELLQAHSAELRTRGVRRLAIFGSTARNAATAKSDVDVLVDIDPGHAFSMMRDAVERNVERLSEASRHLTDELKTSEPLIPWRAIADIGNVLRHGYDRVNPDRIWQVVERDLPVLKAAILRMIDRSTPAPSPATAPAAPPSSS